MNLIYLFRWLVVAQVLMGIVSFCMAEQNPGMLLVAGAVGALSWYIVEGPSGQPMPRWLTNIVGPIAAVAWLIFDLYWQKGNVIIAMGHFTIWLQILELYARKTNRDYGLILVLSLLQMVGATILSASVIFGMLLVMYCVLALFTILLFQLKSTSDLVLEANRKAAPLDVRVARPGPVVARGHRWQFRVTAIVIGAVSTAIAVMVFLLIPRTSWFQGSSELLTPQDKQQVGFIPRVQLDGLNGLGDNPQVVATAKILHNGVSNQSEYWLLRGAALDSYDPYSHTWTRSLGVASRDVTLRLPEHGRELAALPKQTATVEAHISLRKTHRTLFTLHPVTHVAAEDLNAIVFNGTDQQLFATESPSGSVTYTVHSPVSPPEGLFEMYRKSFSLQLPPGAMRMRRAGYRRPSARQYARNWSVQADRVAQYARQIIGQDLQTRDPTALHDPRDQRIADALSEHLRRNFAYTLENSEPSGTDDPIVEFLYDRQQGHCELFASALAAMCRSIGIGARVVTGYCVSEFNRIGGYHVVRQSNAHAWCEIDLGLQGWKTYDATPVGAVEREHFVQRTWVAATRELYEYIDFLWISSIVTYDEETRHAVLSGFNQSIQEKARDQDSLLGTTLAWSKAFWHEWRFNQLNLTLIVVFSFFILVGIASLVHTWVVRRRRIVALQLNRLPRREQRGLARRLSFYLAMLDMLERHGYHRPNWQSPYRFAQDLAAQTPHRFDSVIGLTEAFYEIRFGHRRLDEQRRRLIKTLLRKLERSLAEKT